MAKGKNKYVIIAKVAGEGSGIGNKGYVKYHANNLLSFTSFLDGHYPDWRFFNVFHAATREKLRSFTRYNRPRYEHV